MLLEVGALLSPCSASTRRKHLLSFLAMVLWVVSARSSRHSYQPSLELKRETGVSCVRDSDGSLRLARSGSWGDSSGCGSSLVATSLQCHAAALYS